MYINKYGMYGKYGGKTPEFLFSEEEYPRMLHNTSTPWREQLSTPCAALENNYLSNE